MLVEVKIATNHPTKCYKTTTVALNQLNYGKISEEGLFKPFQFRTSL